LRADGSVHIDLLRATRDRAAAIHDVVIRRSAQGSSNEGGSVKLTRIALCDKVKALDMLARHLGMYPMSERRGRRPTRYPLDSLIPPEPHPGVGGLP
jgi:hypothetical protein